MASEKLRQREVHKYYQSWLDSSIGFDSTPSTQFSRYHADGSQLRTSKDKALIAFAQLGCLKLDVKRAVITLISTDQQYIIAEATRTLSLVSGDGDFAAQDEIWFGNAQLPRSQGVSGDALAPPEYTALGADGTSYTAPALVIEDLTTDDRYKLRPYSGKGVTFYCGVPILTDTGIAIGVYSMTDDKPRNGLKPEELRFMRDMAATVMRHLEVVSNEAARFRGETMILGLGKFVSGARSLREEVRIGGTSTQTASPNLATTTESSFQPLRGMNITAANPSKLRASKTDSNITKSRTLEQVKFADMDNSSSDSQVKPAHTELDSISARSKMRSEAVQTVQRDLSGEQRLVPVLSSRLEALSENVFSRAAKILQECVTADGVLFFDAVATNFAKGSGFGGFVPHKEPRDADRIPRGLGIQDSSDATGSIERKNSTASIYSGASEESDIGASNESEKRMCKLLGHALDEPSQSTTSIDVLQNLQLTERSLSRLVKLYPQGKLFTFHSDGGFSASDGEHLTEDASSTMGQPRTQKSWTADRSRRIPRAIAHELERLVPHAQSIIWLPLWDFSKQRWSAGLFLWSRRIDRLVAAQDDLVYLKAFANSIMVEVARIDAARADTAKSTFIANISHELRTPLHGIVGNLDILQDTKLSEFQQSLVTAIEVCGRTLSDTIDHVLDYSKINQLSKHSKKRSKSSSIALPSLSQGLLSSSSSSMNEEDFDIAAIVEEAVEAAYASYAFQTSGRTRLRASSLTGSQPARMVSESPKSPNVHVFMSFEYRSNWLVHSQPSAIRRVITNLFGNALKYTDSGTIQVSLTSTRLAKSFDSGSSIPVVLSVKDTGRGMSREFVRNHAFMPFSQESQFSTGTGLGLSIVQQIVKSLGGSIELQSDQGVGTEIKVFLDLPVGWKEEPSNRGTISPHPKPMLQKQSGSGLSLKVSIDQESNAGPPPMGLLSVVSSLETMAQHWFNLRIEPSDILGPASTDLVLYLTPPSVEHLEKVMSSSSRQSDARFIVVALNTIEKATLNAKYAEIPPHLDLRVEVISYPVGPQKLGQALFRCITSAGAKSILTSQDDGFGEDTSWPRLPSLEAETMKAKIEWSVKETASETTGAQEPSDMSHASNQILRAESSFPPPSRTQSIFMEEPPSVVPVHLSTNPLTEYHETVPADQGSTQPRSLPVLPRSISAPVPILSNDRGVANGAPMRILLVDDNDINLNILKTCMKRARIPYDFARDGLEASNTFQHAFNTDCKFTHVLMDISMPVMDGIQSTRQIRDFEQRQSSLQRGPPRTYSHGQPLASIETKLYDEQADTAVSRAIIIALSGVASEVTQLEMLEAGADMFLPKPVKLKELLRILAA